MHQTEQLENISVILTVVLHEQNAPARQQLHVGGKVKAISFAHANNALTVYASAQQVQKV